MSSSREILFKEQFQGYSSRLKVPNQNKHKLHVFMSRLSINISGKKNCWHSCGGSSKPLNRLRSFPPITELRDWNTSLKQPDTRLSRMAKWSHKKTYSLGKLGFGKFAASVENVQCSRVAISINQQLAVRHFSVGAVVKLSKCQSQVVHRPVRVIIAT